MPRKYKVSTRYEDESKSEDSLEKARKTAEKISLKEAQIEFEGAEKYHLRHAASWLSISILFLFALLWLVYYFYTHDDFHKYVSKAGSDNNLKWYAIHYTTCKFSILGIIAALAAFSLKLFKCHAHMREQSLHRKRVINSIEAFLESASTKEQKDLILAQIVNSVISFGNLGILGHKDEDPKIDFSPVFKLPDGKP